MNIVRVGGEAKAVVDQVDLADDGMGGAALTLQVSTAAALALAARLVAVVTAAAAAGSRVPATWHATA